MAETQAETADLVARARAGDEDAWNQLVERMLPLVFSVISRFRLSSADAHDVNATVWLRLVEHLDDLREPAALPGWLASTTRNEALSILRRRDRQIPFDPLQWTGFDSVGGSPPDQELLVEERRHALREGLRQLTPERRDLLVLLLHDPPLAYAEIARRLNHPIGWIGPTRARALADLRSTPALRSMLEVDLEERRG